MAELAQPLDPGTLGQSPENPGGLIFIPAAHSGEFMGTGAAKEGGKHEAEDFAQKLLLGFQAPFDLGHEVVGKAQIVEGLTECVDGALGVVLLALVASFGVEPAAAFRFGLFFGVCFG